MGNPLFSLKVLNYTSRPVFLHLETYTVFKRVSVPKTGKLIAGGRSLGGSLTMLEQSHPSPPQRVYAHGSRIGIHNL